MRTSNQSSNRLRVGSEGEVQARRFLESMGYRFVSANVRTRWGEIDLVMEDGGTLVFVEVKKRRAEAYGCPEESVHFAKQRHLVRAAVGFLQSRQIVDQAFRFDVISIESSGIRHIRDAFDGGSEYYY